MRAVHIGWKVVAATCVLALAYWLLQGEFGPAAGPGAVTPDPTSPGTESEAEPSSGDLHFTETQVDLGVIKAETEYHYEFHNRGRREVRLLKVRPSCACAVTQPDKTVFLPGDKGRLGVAVKPRPDRIGRQTDAIDVEYRGATVQTVRLLLHYQARPDVITSEQLRLRAVSGQPARIEFTLVDYRDNPLRITRITTSTPELRARVVEEPSQYLPGWRYRLEASLVEREAAPGEYHEVVTLHTDDADRPRIPVEVIITRARRLRMAPTRLQLRSSPDSGAVVGKLFVDDTEGDLVEIVSVTPSDARLQCLFDPKPAPRVVIEVRLTGRKVAEESVPGHVLVTVKKPVRAALSVPVSWDQR
jgi:hypothetical protein